MPTYELSRSFGRSKHEYELILRNKHVNHSRAEVAFVASVPVPVRAERNIGPREGRAENRARANRSKEGGGGGESQKLHIRLVVGTARISTLEKRNID